MSTLGIIILVVVVVAILVALFAFLPRMRERRRIKTGERELGQRRERVVSEQRQEAERRAERAEAAEQQARIAAAEAERERAEANLHQQQAAKHEQGMADHELVDDHERDRFAGTSAAPDVQPGQGIDKQGSADRGGDEQRLADR
jgi:FtsZ-interacting cell division protein ZipA